MVFFVALASVGLPLVSLSVLTSDYRLKRVLGFIAPAYDPADLSYQVNGSIRAIAAGGFWGKGLGQGTLKIRSIPEVQSDFVFAAWAEETGFVGVLAFAALWAFFLWRAFRASFEAPDPFRRHLAFGLACYLAIQMLINIMVVSGAAPATGIPLPFFSSGGSSLISVVIERGPPVQRVAKRRAGICQGKGGHRCLRWRTPSAITPGIELRVSGAMAGIGRGSGDDARVRKARPNDASRHDRHGQVHGSRHRRRRSTHRARRGDSPAGDGDNPVRNTRLDDAQRWPSCSSWSGMPDKAHLFSVDVGALEAEHQGSSSRIFEPMWSGIFPTRSS